MGALATARPVRGLELASGAPRLRLLAPPDEDAAARAHRAWLAAARGSAPAAHCAAMAVDALADGTLLATAGQGSAYHLCVGVLIASDAAEPARHAIAALRDYAIARTSRPMRAVATWYESELELRRGNVAAAEQLATDALALASEPGEPLPAFAAGPLRVFASALAERGDLI